VEETAVRLPSRKSALLPAIVCALALVLVTLGVLQYRWSNEISEAARSRMRADLIRSMMDFRRDFVHELASVAFALEPNYSYGSDFDSYTRKFANWRRTASNPGMVQEVYIWQHSQLLKTSGKEPELVEWPPELAQFRATAVTSLPVSSFLLRAPDPFRRGRDSRPSEAGKLGVALGVPPDPVTRMDSPFAVSRASVSVAVVEADAPNSIGIDIQHEAIAGDPRTFVLQLKHRGIVTLNGSPWMVIPSIPALVHPLVMPSPTAKRSGKGRIGRAGWMIIPLNQAFLAEHLFPELATRHFSGLDYEVGVVGGERGNRTIYSSNPEAAKRSLADADASMNLFSIPGSQYPHEIGSTALPVLKGVKSAIKYSDLQHIFGGQETMELLPMPGLPGLDGWLLVANHRRGSLEAAVAALRRRHLAMSFGVLLVLAATTGVITLAARRVQELARLQMDFVAGVSHELRTPLTVISSAADNIADGVVENREQMAHYGAALKGQASQLRELVEQILLFAATRDNRQTYGLRAVQVADALDLALQNTADLIRRAGFAVECHASRDLPNVLIDLQALARCLQNLITNAIKYGGNARWISIEAKTEGTGREVTVSVRDRGIGIGPGDMKHIFDPFYRATSVRDAQIHGTGLGLPLAKSIVEGMRGRITVESEPGRGSSFTVRLPVAEAVAAARAQQAIDILP
jgi:signal transduction histidine kinase